MADAMHEAMLDARHEGGSYRRVEVITGQRRRRHWTAEEKARIVAESFEAGANISEVARRHGVVRGLLTTWRRQFASSGAKLPSFVPLRIEAEHSVGPSGEPGSVGPAPVSTRPQIVPRPDTAGAIEIEVNGARIRVEPGADAVTLCTVLSVLRDGR
ncbi:IS66-like element accessory protein TnpA [Bradyrhizobium sp. STM 3562]|uniref:IS66-like element accessory protein TnpA n=1 Tax=Bradyrhizobium sp. STM 3562 TaxID=578924 RepID=UPI00388F82AB